MGTLGPLPSCCATSGSSGPDCPPRLKAPSAGCDLALTGLAEGALSSLLPSHHLCPSWEDPEAGAPAEGG